MERRSKRRKVTYKFLDDSDSDDDFTPTVKKTRKLPNENKKVEATIEKSRLLRSEEIRFQRELEMALAESRNESMVFQCDANTALTNAVSELEKVEPKVGIMKQDDGCTLEIDSSCENGGIMSDQNSSVQSSSSQVIDVSTFDSTLNSSLTAAVVSCPNSCTAGRDLLSKTLAKNRTPTLDRTTARDVFSKTENASTPVSSNSLSIHSLPIATKSHPSTKVTDKNTESGIVSATITSCQASVGPPVSRPGILQNMSRKNRTSPMIRLGLSRNARIRPLHPRPPSITQKLTQ